MSENPSGIVLWRVPGASGIGPGPFRNAPERRKRKKSISGRKKIKITKPSGPVFGDFRVPAGSPKSTKNAPGGEKARPETAPEAVFVVFSRRRRSESLSGPIFGRSDPRKSYYFLGGSAILKKSPFSKKRRKSSLRGSVSEPKTTKNRRRGEPKSQKSEKKVVFLRSFFSTFFSTRKKSKKIEKRAKYRPPS